MTRTQSAEAQSAEAQSAGTEVVTRGCASLDERLIAQTIDAELAFVGGLGTGPIALEIECVGDVAVLIGMRGSDATPRAVDVSDVKWDAAKQSLSGRSKVVGGDEYELRLHAGGAARLSNATVTSSTSDGVTVTSRQDGEHVRVAIKSATTGEVAWQVRFSGAASASATPSR